MYEYMQPKKGIQEGILSFPLSPSASAVIYS